jgi:hypothetical protein
MKNKLALKFNSIQLLSKNAQKEINGGQYRPCNGSLNHPCNSGSPYYGGYTNCVMYCNSGGYCC